MTNITLPLDIELVVPILEMCKEYFDTKYPCTTDDNDGSNMPIEDSIKELAYNYLLLYYNKNKPIIHKGYTNYLHKIKIKNENK